MPEPNRGRTQNLGAPKPDSHLGTFATKPKTGVPCGHPELQELLPALFAGSLAKTGRQVERRRLERHVRTCAACRAICVEHAHRTVTLLILKEAAQQFGITVPELQRRLERSAARMARTPMPAASCRALPSPLVQENDLIGVAARQAVWRVDVDPLDCAGRSEVAQPFQGRANKGCAAVAVVDKLSIRWNAFTSAFKELVG